MKKCGKKRWENLQVSWRSDEAKVCKIWVFIDGKVYEFHHCFVLLLFPWKQQTSSGSFLIKVSRKNLVISKTWFEISLQNFFCSKLSTKLRNKSSSITWQFLWKGTTICAHTFQLILMKLRTTFNWLKYRMSRKRRRIAFTTFHKKRNQKQNRFNKLTFHFN